MLLKFPTIIGVQATCPLIDWLHVGELFKSKPIQIVQVNYLLFLCTWPVMAFVVAELS